jgi:hypothetical protein
MGKMVWIDFWEFKIIGLYKINRKYRTGRVDHMVEHLLSKCEALSSDPSKAKKKKK